MKILVLEDNKQKAEHIINFLKSNFQEIEIDHVISLNSAVRDLIKGNYDFAILDNMVPRYEKEPNGEIIVDVSLIILDYLEDYEKETKCIICSSEDISKQKNATLLGYEQCIGKIKYDCFSDDWQPKLKKLLENK